MDGLIGTSAAEPIDLVMRPAAPGDLEILASMFHALWPDTTVEGHALELAPLLSGGAPGSLPTAILVAADGGARLVGFVHVGLRSHADGCDTSHPVGYIEGWFVDQAYRRRRIGARLVAAAEDWARRCGCREMASDTWIDNLESQRAHEALGFQVVDRCVNYRKAL